MQFATTDNIGQLFLRAAVSNPGDAALIDGVQPVSYGQLAEASVAVALGLHARGMRRGSVVAVRSGDPSLLLATLFATALIGSRWVFAHDNLIGSNQLYLDLILFDDASDLSRLPRAVRVDASWFAPRSGEGQGRQLPFGQDHHPQEVWMISQTSGTTGTPKLVGLSQQVVLGRIAANAARLSWQGLRLASLFPASAPIFLTYAITALLHRGAVVTGCAPQDWKQQGVGLAIASPMQAQRVLSGRPLAAKPEVLQLSGGPATETLVRQLLESFERVLVGYGSTEGFNALTTEKRLGDNGEITSKTTLAPGVTVEIVDENDVPVPPGDLGIVRITNPYLALGYLNSPEAQATTFREGWFYPGDLAQWSDTGELVIAGRTNDQFNLGGKKLNAQVMDAVLLDVPGVRDAICFMMPGTDGTDGLRVFLSVDPAADISIVTSEARIALMRLAGVAAVPKRFLFADTLPRNANGKADRRACIAIVEAAKASRGNPRGPQTQG